MQSSSLNSQIMDCDRDSGLYDPDGEEEGLNDGNPTNINKHTYYS